MSSPTLVQSSPNTNGHYDQGGIISDKPIVPQRPQLSSLRLSSPGIEHSLPDDGADSHQSGVHFHQKELNASNGLGYHLTSSHYRSKLNSTSKVKPCSRPEHPSNVQSPEKNDTQRFRPYFSPQKLLSHSQALSPSSISGKSSNPRKRHDILKPKFPKYKGLTSFAAPADLVSDIMPCNNPIDIEGSLSPFLQSASCSMNRNDKMNLGHITDSTNPSVRQNEESSAIPLEFLKYLDFEEWQTRKNDLLKMVEERKKLFESNGFAETSGKAFQPDEQGIEKKPVPNRWVWYMHLSTDYDKMKNTRVPPGGPAGYLKYGWDRLGPAGKQPYQELADIYSAQRLKFMAEHGIKEDTTKKKIKQAAKPKGHDRSISELIRSGDNSQIGIGFGTGSPHLNDQITYLSSTHSLKTNVPSQVPSAVNPPFASIQSSKMTYEESNHQFQNKGETYDYVHDTSMVYGLPEVSYSSYVQAPKIISESFSPLFHEGLYGAHMNSEPGESIGMRMGLPSPPTEYAFTCSPASTFHYQASPEFQGWSALSPESINSTHSDISGVFSTSCWNHAVPPTPACGSLSPLNAFLEPFTRQEIDSPVPESGKMI